MNYSVLPATRKIYSISLKALKEQFSKMHWLNHLSALLLLLKENFEDFVDLSDSKSVLFLQQKVFFLDILKYFLVFRIFFENFWKYI